MVSTIRNRSNRPGDRYGETALITGASAGIGRALAAQFGARGYNLVLVARSTGKLRKLAAELRDRHRIVVTVLTRDLLQADAPRTLLEAVSERDIDIDVLVNNAGVLSHGEFKDQELDELQRIMQLNNAVLVEMTHRFLQPMLSRGHGRVLNISSLSAFNGTPTLAVYAASKAFILSFSEALHEEVRPHGVTVTAQCPGFTRTNMLDGFERLPGMFIADVDAVAAEALQACETGQAINVPGRAYRLLSTALRYSPRQLVRRTLGQASRELLPDHQLITRIGRK
jgi:short-subunit dehydrogenase